MDVLEMIACFGQLVPVGRSVIRITCVTEYFESVAIMPFQQAPNLVSHGMVFEVAGKVCHAKASGMTGWVYKDRAIWQLTDGQRMVSAPATGNL